MRLPPWVERARRAEGGGVDMPTPDSVRAKDAPDVPANRDSAGIAGDVDEATKMQEAYRKTVPNAADTSTKLGRAARGRMTMSERASRVGWPGRSGKGG